MAQQDPVVRGGIIAIALTLGIALSGAIYAGYFRPKGPKDPESFHLTLEDSRSSYEPSNIGVSIAIDPTGNYAVVEAACNAQPDFTRQEWFAACNQQKIRQGSIYRQEVLNLRDAIRSRGFYRWRPKYKNAFGNNDAARICLFEESKRKCVLVQTGVYFGWDAGPKDFWGARKIVYRLTSTPIGWGEGASNQAQ